MLNWLNSRFAIVLAVVASFALFVVPVALADGEATPEATEEPKISMVVEDELLKITWPDGQEVHRPVSGLVGVAPDVCAPDSSHVYVIASQAVDVFTTIGAGMLEQGQGYYSPFGDQSASEWGFAFFMRDDGYCDLLQWRQLEPGVITVRLMGPEAGNDVAPGFVHMAVALAAAAAHYTEAA